MPVNPASTFVVFFLGGGRGRSNIDFVELKLKICIVIVRNADYQCS